MGCSLFLPLPVTPPRLHSLQEVDENCFVFTSWPLVFDVMDSRFGRFCVFSAGKTNSSEKPQIEHWGKIDKKKQNKTQKNQSGMDLFPPTEVSDRDPASECSQDSNPIYYAYYVGLLIHGISSHADVK